MYASPPPEKNTVNKQLHGVWKKGGKCTAGQELVCIPLARFSNKKHFNCLESTQTLKIKPVYNVLEKRMSTLMPATWKKAAGLFFLVVKKRGEINIEKNWEENESLEREKNKYQPNIYECAIVLFLNLGKVWGLLAILKNSLHDR